MRVVVETGARIHLGFYILLPIRRMWGGIGLAVDGIGYELVIEESSSGFRVEGCQRARLHKMLEEAREKLRIDTPVVIKAKRCIPEHRGFGSTTQAKLAIFYGLAQLAGVKLDIYKLAELAGRGTVSGVGVNVFKYGGLVVDAGKRLGSHGVPRLLTRLEFPEEWRIVYVTPLTTWRVTEESEQVFQGAVSYEKQCELYDIVFGSLLPAVVERNFEEFTSAVSKLQRIMGEYFSKAQAGIYCCKESEEVAKTLEAHGGRGVGQSSWGPTVYAFFPNEQAARETLNTVLSELESKGVRVEMYGVLKPRNYGARVKMLD